MSAPDFRSRVYQRLTPCQSYLVRVRRLMNLRRSPKIFNPTSLLILAKPLLQCISISNDFLESVSLCGARLVDLGLSRVLTDDVDDLERFTFDTAAKAVKSILSLEILHEAEGALEKDAGARAAKRSEE